MDGLQLLRAQFCINILRIYLSLEDFSLTYFWLYTMWSLLETSFIFKSSVLFHELLQNSFSLCKSWPYFHGKILLNSVKFYTKSIFVPAKNGLSALWRLCGNTNEISLPLCITMYLCYSSPVPIDFFCLLTKFIIWHNTTLHLVKF